MANKKIENREEILKWISDNPREKTESREAYYARCKEAIPDMKYQISWFYVNAVRNNGSGRLAHEGAGISQEIREWAQKNPLKEGEKINEYYARCEVKCTMSSFQYAIRYTPNDEYTRRERPSNVLPPIRGTFYKQGDKVDIYTDYIRREQIEGKAELTEYIDRGQPLIVKGRFVSVEIWNVKFDNGFEARRKLLCR